MSAIKELSMLLSQTGLTLKVYGVDGKMVKYSVGQGKNGVKSGSPGSMVKAVREIEAVVSEEEKPNKTRI
jgi:hypothetical protein